MTLLTKQEIEALLDPFRSRSGTEALRKLRDAAPDLMDTALDALARLEDAEAAQALVVERLRVPLQFMVDSIAEDKAYVAEKYPILFALIQARRAEMGTLGGVQVFGEIARDLLGILTADPSGVAALVALRAERDALKVPYDELYADALADAKSDAQDFESDLWKSIRSILNDLDYDWSGDAMEDGVTADEAAQFIRDALEGETHRAEKAEAERDDLRARLAAAEGRVAALTDRIRWAHDTLWELNPNNYDHDEVCKVNNAAVEVILGLAPIIGETHGYSSEWWETRGVKMRLETVSENLARDMAEGRFPKRSAPKMVPDAALATVTPPADTTEGRT